jgi:SAM-dependent methyltransferase
LTNLTDSNSQNRFIPIDDEGYFKFGDVRVSDQSIGAEMLARMRFDENNRLITEIDGVQAFVEAFDEPLVAIQVFENSGKLTLQMPYGFIESFSAEGLTLDEWDRFHGFSSRGIPFVLSRTAQASFFNILEDYDDTSITWNGQKIEVPLKLSEVKQVDQENFWSKHYLDVEKPGWELGAPTPVLKDVLAQLKLPKSRILVLGAGSGHDAAFLAQQGHLVTAVDVSPEAEKKFHENYPGLRNITYLTLDLFNLPEKMVGAYDVIFEHTLFCAINPARRNELIKIWLKCLAEKGHLLAVFFVHLRPGGPPFGASEWELHRRLNKKFDFLYWTRWKKSIPRRLGQELVVYAQKKSF